MKLVKLSNKFYSEEPIYVNMDAVAYFHSSADGGSLITLMTMSGL